MSKQLQKARDYEQEMIKQIPEGQKPVFHISAPTGWINDPNGFSVYRGAYHLFYQYHPYSTAWGPMHWGHSRTTDFIRWEQLPCAIAPDERYDGQGCFSGSALEHDGKQVLMYTGVLEEPDEGGGKRIRQTQCIAIGDGIDYEKSVLNPVITADSLPEGSSLEDFRDPKIWKEEDAFYAVIGSRSADGSGQLALYRSQNLQIWNYVTILDQCSNRYGKMWECPDYFELDSTWVILTSPQDMLAEGLEFHSGNGTICLTGSYDRERHTFVRSGEEVRAIDYGLDFYAPQTLVTEDGRRIMIGWMQNWDNYMTPAEYAWSGMMSIPRELHVKQGRLIQNPVREIGNYYGTCVNYEHVQAKDWLQLEGIGGRVLDMTVDVKPGCYSRFSIRIAANDRFHTSLTYLPDSGVLTFDRTYNGSCRDRIGVRSVQTYSRGGAFRLRIMLDRYSAEIFVNDGEQAVTSLLYTPQDADGILFCMDGEGEFDVTAHEILERAITE